MNGGNIPHSQTSETAQDRRYYGKYQAKVVDNYDKKGEMRLQVVVPDVSDKPLESWAKCSTPVGGPDHGLFSVPPLKSGVWVEFQQGDIDFPVWSGCFWGNESEVPERSKSVHRRGNQSITLQTPSKHSITISDKGSEGIEIKTPNKKTRIQLTDRKITLHSGQASIILDGPNIKIDATKVSINGQALVITK